MRGTFTSSDATYKVCAFCLRMDGKATHHDFGIHTIFVYIMLMKFKIERKAKRERTWKNESDEE